MTFAISRSYISPAFSGYCCIPLPEELQSSYPNRLRYKVASVATAGVITPFTEDLIEENTQFIVTKKFIHVINNGVLPNLDEKTWNNHKGTHGRHWKILSDFFKEEEKRIRNKLEPSKTDTLYKKWSTRKANSAEFQKAPKTSIQNILHKLETQENKKHLFEILSEELKLETNPVKFSDKMRKMRGGSKYSPLKKLKLRAKGILSNVR